MLDDRSIAYTRPESPIVPSRLDFLGTPLDPVTMEEAVDLIDEAIRSRRLMRHVAMNAAKLVATRRDSLLDWSVQTAGLVTADGQSIVWAARLLGQPVPERVTGIDLMGAVLSLAERRGYRVFSLGAQQDVVDDALAGSRHPPQGARPRRASTGARHPFLHGNRGQSRCRGRSRPARPSSHAAAGVGVVVPARAGAAPFVAPVHRLQLELRVDGGDGADAPTPQRSAQVPARNRHRSRPKLDSSPAPSTEALLGPGGRVSSRTGA